MIRNQTTVPLELELGTTYLKDDDHEHPPPPVLLTYVSDGTVQLGMSAGAYGGMYLVDPNITSSGVATAST